SDEIQRLLAGKAVGVRFGIGAQAFSLGGSTVPSDLEDQFNLMAAQLLAPGYREEAKARYDKYIESWYPTLDSTPAGVASRDISRILRSNDPRYGIPNQAELLGEEIDSVKEWISPHLLDGQIEIAVVGDIKKEVVVEQVARTFGALPERKRGHESYPEMMQLTFPDAPRKPITLTHSGDANRALLRVYWPAPDGTDVMRNRRMSILRSIFGNRLTDVIREEEGAAYSPSAGRNGSRFYKDYGYMSASLGLTPEKVPEMITVLDEVATDFQSGNISQDEFDRAIKPVLENLDTSLENNGYWMRVISNAQTDSWDIDNFRTREDAYKNMTLDDIKPLAAEIFKPNKAVRIQVLPEK
ncbi:MAG: insulinase family protein, partial [Acidimicrobiales bacterium]